MIRKLLFILRLKSIICSLALLLFAILLSGCISTKKYSDSVGTIILEPNEIPNEVQKIPDYITFGFWGLTFYKDNLFAVSNVGLFEFRDRQIFKLYKWFNEDNVVSGPWVDISNQSLWIMRDHDGELIYLDDNGWHFANTPKSPKGYFSRGDILSGFECVSTSTGFWLVGGGYAWLWESDNQKWKLEPIPPAQKYSGIVSLAPTTYGLIYIVREGVGSFINKNEYSAYIQNGDTWNHTTLGEFIFADALNIEGTIYISSEAGELMKLENMLIQKLETPGKCQAITKTTDNKLLAVFKDKGIFILNDKWDKLFNYPCESIKGTQWVYLAENKGEIALSIILPTNPSFGRRHKSALWISINGKLSRINATSITGS